MKITEFLNADAISDDLQKKDKADIIGELVDLLVSNKSIEKKNRKKVIEVLLARESLGSTAIGQGIAIPHGKCDCVKDLVGALGISKEGVNFDSLDGSPAHIFFLLLAPIDSAGPHLKALARISRLLKDKFIRDSLVKVQTKKEVLEIIEREDVRLSNL